MNNDTKTHISIIVALFVGITFMFVVSAPRKGTPPPDSENVAPKPAATVAPAYTAPPQSDSCNSIVECQQYLASNGYANVVVDGKFGLKTHGAWLKCYNSGNCSPRIMPGSNSESISCHDGFIVTRGPFIASNGQACVLLYRPSNDTSYVECTMPDSAESGCAVFANASTLIVSQVCCNASLTGRASDYL